MKKGRSKSIYVLTTQDGGGQKRKYPYNTTSNEKMSRSRILVPRVTTRMCLLLSMPPRRRALRENAIIATSLDIRGHIAGS